MLVSNLKQVGLGLRTAHYDTILNDKPKLSWLEVHSENYYTTGRHLDYLEKISAFYRLSLHCVGLSLGSIKGPDAAELSSLKKLVDQFDPLFVSAHLCWSSVNNVYLNDLLPLPYTEESMTIISAHIDKVQNHLGRPLLIENISSYLEYTHSTMTEADFMSKLSKKTDCEILLDLNNLYVNSINHQFDPKNYLQILPAHKITEIHLAGFTKNDFEESSILIDTHDQPISEAVWQLYEKTIAYLGPRPTLIEWDNNLPSLSVLLAETKRANRIMEKNYVSLA